MLLLQKEIHEVLSQRYLGNCQDAPLHFVDGETGLGGKPFVYNHPSNGRVRISGFSTPRGFR